jgi:hypothetical protein
MAVQKTKPALSVLEFKAWLEGVEDMQGATWIPSKEQWKKIRSKIQLLADTIEQPGYIQQQQLYPQQLYPYHQPATSLEPSASVNLLPTVTPPGLAPIELSNDIGKVTDAGDYLSPFT